ncbi:unnamed protein product, partial [Prunus brigantina]
MANLAKLEFAALDISGDNYLSWVLDAKIHLRANGLGKAIEDGSDASPEEKAKAMIFLRRHIHEALKSEYVVIDEPLVLWKALCERYNHQKTVTLPRARYEWTHLRFQDFKTVTFHASNVLLQQQYRHSGFTKYSELVSCLLLAEQNNELLLKNHQSRPTGSAPLPETNAASREVNATSSRDSATTHTILRHRKYFSNLMLTKAKVTTISGPADLIEGSGIAQVVLPNGTILSIQDALYSSNSRRNLLSFKDIRLNGYHVETKNEENMEYLCITSSNTQKHILEKLRALSSGLYYTTIQTIEAHSVMDQKSIDSNTFKLWHDRLGHPGSTMMRRIITNSKGHPLLTKHIMVSSDNLCQACSQGKLKLVLRWRGVDVESPSFLQRIQGDICGPIHPPCGPFRYFMVLVDASTRWSHVCLLSTQNIAFARLLAQIIKVRAQFPDYPIKSIRLYNAGEFTSQTFDDYCMSLGIDIEHPVPHVHTQNGLAEALIKRLQLIARTLLMKTKLPISA